MKSTKDKSTKKPFNVTIKSINPEELKQVDLSKGMILDIRTQMEHTEKHLACRHAHVPFDEGDPKKFMMRHGFDKDGKVYILCESGARSKKMAEKFTSEGYENIYVIKGGLKACENIGHEIKERDAQPHMVKHSVLQVKGFISLERQVRIAAGLFAVFGAGLALTIHSLFALIPLFVGLGLIFAGVTDRCGVALILTKAPWNKIKDPSDASSATSDLSSISRSGKTRK